MVQRYDVCDAYKGERIPEEQVAERHRCRVGHVQIRFAVRPRLSAIARMVAEPRYGRLPLLL